MLFLFALVIATVAAWLVPARYGGRSAREAARRGLGVAFVLAGLSHFALRDSFLVYFPDWIPFPMALVVVTGVVEIIGGLALVLLPHRYQRWTGIALAIYLVAVFPANLYVAVSGVEEGLPGLPASSWYPWVRLPFQALFVWWALWSTAGLAATATAPGLPGLSRR